MKNLIGLFAVLAVILVELVGFQVLSSASPLATAFYPVDFARPRTFQEMGSWYQLINLTTNQFVIWRSDPLITYLCTLLMGDKLSVYFPSLSLNLVICWSGLAILFFQRCADRLISAVAASLVALTIPLIFGLDRILIESITWIPLLAVVLRAIRERESLTPPLFLALIFLSVRVCFSTNQLTPLWVATAWLWADSAHARTSHRVVKVCALLAVLLPTLISLLSAKYPGLPDYPSFAHVVPDDGLPGFSRPLLGPDFQIPVINREAVKASASMFLVCILLFSAIIFGIFRSPDRASSRLLVYAVVLALCSLLLDLFLPESLSEIAPLLTLARVVPNWFQFSLNLSVALFLFLSISIVLIERKQFTRAATFCLLLIVIAVIAPLNPKGSRSALLAHFSVIDRSEIDAVERDLREASLASPSYYAINYFGYPILENRDALQQSVVQSLFTTRFKINASDNGDSRSLSRLSDGNENSRWSPKTGKQTGREWIEIYWPTKIYLRGLELSTGKFSADFPRGLKISYQSDCTLEERTPTNYLPLVSYSNWQGALEFSTSGYPYFGSQSKVHIMLPKPTELECLLIEQTGVSESFDWSVAELGLIH